MNMKSEREKLAYRRKSGTCKFLCYSLSLLSLFLSLSLPPPSSLLLQFPSSSSLVLHGPRFKYQRRLKSDLYHAESCYLYRFIGDLLARYSERGILVQHRVDRGANIVQDKGSHQDFTRGEGENKRRKRRKKTGGKGRGEGEEEGGDEGGGRREEREGRDSSLDHPVRNS